MFVSAAIAVLLLGVGQAQAASSAFAASPEPETIETPGYLLTPGTAQLISGLTLGAGVLAGTLLAVNGKYAAAAGVGTGSFVFAPTVGGVLGAALERARGRTG